MKKLLLIIGLCVLCLSQVNAKNVYADLNEDQTIGNGTWTASTHTFEWTANTNARMILNGLSGDLSDCATLVLETSDYTNSFRVDFVAEDGTITGSNATGTQFYSAGVKTIDLKKVFAEHLDWMGHVTEIRLNTGSSEGSIKLSSAYLVKPLTSLAFDAQGVATIDFADLMAQGANFSETTGELTSEDGKGSLSISLPREGIDMTSVVTMLVEYEGNDIINNLEVANPDKKIVGAYSSKYKLNMAQYAAETSHVNKFTWNINKVGKMTIKSIKFLNATATGILHVNVANQQKKTVLYNLSGMRVSHPKGIVVSNGKKYIAK